MKKITFFLIVMLVSLCAMQAGAQQAKEPATSNICRGLVSSNYMDENGKGDSGLGGTIVTGSTLNRLAIRQQDREDMFTYEVEAYDIDGWNDLAIEHPAHIWGYYEHPYGQEGYIEYQVDGFDGDWSRIDPPMISGEVYDLTFNMIFNSDETMTHTLNIRFTDGLGNYTDLNGLSWTDVRSNEITGIEDRVYNGQPQTFDVSYNGNSFTIGTNGEYIEPGDYSYSIEGNYAENTIGVYTVDFTIFKAQSEISYTVPEDCVYDGEAHAATVQLVAGDGDLIVTYVKGETREASTEAPVEPGTYSVVATVTETEFYFGLEKTIGSFTIDKAPCEFDVVVPQSVMYDGLPHPATVTVTHGGEPVVTYMNVTTGKVSVDDPIEVGEYYVIVEIPETEHYYGLESTMFGPFEIYFEVTSVQEISIADKVDSAWYTIQGIRVAAPAEPGIYIHNGKKYIVK